MKIKKTFWLLFIACSMIGSHVAAYENCTNFECKDEEIDTCELFCCKPHFAIRSQASNTARTLVGRAKDVHLSGFPDVSYHVANVTLGYSKSFRTKDEIGTYFSPACTNPCSGCGPCINFGGDSEDVIDVRSADFGSTCTGSLCLCPEVSNVLIELDWFVGLHAFCEGLFFDIHIPIVHSRWNSGADACTGSCSDVFGPGVMDMSTTQSTDNGTNSFCAAANGNFVWGDVWRPMDYGKFCSGKLTTTQLADLQMELGYDYLLEDDYHLGAKLILKIPSGNAPKGRYVFEPIVGNEGHFEFGIGGTTHYVLFTRNDNDRFVWYFEGDLTHVFTGRKQKRLFDLKKNGCFSRYLLLKTFNNGQVNGLERGPNVFAQMARTDFGLQVDLTSLWSYQTQCWDYQLGYNFWGRSHENIKELCCTIPSNTYGIKGTQLMTNNMTASRSTIRENKGSQGIDDGDEPLYIRCDDLDPCSALVPSATSHSFVGYIGYTDTSKPLGSYFGLGTQIEFSGKKNAALDQWHIWLKGGWSW